MPPAGQRLIDAIPSVSPRPRQMQVLALGMSRTGTYSMYTALNMLGFKAYHCGEIYMTPAGTFDLWTEALRAKYHGDGDRYGKVEMDKLLGNYSAITDVPCIMFTEELLEMYPDAKILITTRDEDSWLRSITTLFNTILGWNWRFIAPFDKDLMQPYIKMLTTIWDIMTDGDWKAEAPLRQKFRDHYAMVRSKVPSDRLLEFDPKQGWGPLCKHLGVKEVPAEPYPHINDLPFTISLFGTFWWQTAFKAVKTVAIRVMIPGVAIVASTLWLRTTR